jgi:hypothetical protein
MDPNLYTSQRSGKPVLTKAGYWAFIPLSLPPTLDLTLSLVSTLSEAERELGHLSALAEAKALAMKMSKELRPELIEG